MIAPTFKLAKVVLRTAEVKRAVKNASVEPVAKAALMVKRAAQKSMHSGGGAKGVPSPPGTPPNVQRGWLRASIETAPSSRWSYVVGPTIPYGKVHEFGGEWGGRNYPARPYMKPALRKVMNKFPRLWRGLKLGGRVRI